MAPSSPLVPHERIGNLWDLHREHPNCFIVIPTNGVVKANGEAVMGAGLAKQAAQRFPTLPTLLGHAIQNKGNSLHCWPDLRLYALPTKTHFSLPSDLSLICRGLIQLAQAMTHFPDSVVYCPHLGCGLGQLEWPRVRAAITPHLTARMIFVGPS